MYAEQTFWAYQSLNERTVDLNLSALCNPPMQSFPILHRTQSQSSVEGISGLKLYCVQGNCNSDPSARSTTIQITDVCPECEADHIDIQALTFNKVRNSLKMQMVSSCNSLRRLFVTWVSSDQALHVDTLSDCIQQLGLLSLYIHEDFWTQEEVIVL